MHSRSSQKRSRWISENAAGKGNSCEREEQGECKLRLKKAHTSRTRNTSMLTWYQFSNGFALRPILLTTLRSRVMQFSLSRFSPHGLVRYVVKLQ